MIEMGGLPCFSPSEIKKFWIVLWKKKLKPQKASQNLTSKQNSAGNSRSDKIIIGFIQTLRRKKRKEKEKKKPFVRTKQNPQSPVSNHTQRRPITALSRPMNEHLRHWVRGTQWWMGRLGYGRRRCCLECHTALPIMGFLPHWDFDTSKP